MEHPNFKMNLFFLAVLLLLKVSDASTTTSATIASPETTTTTLGVTQSSDTTTTTSGTIQSSDTTTATSGITQSSDTTTTTSGITQSSDTTTTTSGVTQSSDTTTTTSGTIQSSDTTTATSGITQSPDTTTTTSGITQSSDTTTATSGTIQSSDTTTATSGITQSPDTATTTSGITQSSDTTTATSGITQSSDTTTTTSGITQSSDTTAATSGITQSSDTTKATSGINQSPDTTRATSSTTQSSDTTTATSDTTQSSDTTSETSGITKSSDTTTATSGITQSSDTTTATSGITQSSDTTTATSSITQSSDTTTSDTATSTTPAMTTTLPQSGVTSKPKLDSSVFRLSFVIYIKHEFNETLKDSSKELYKEFKEEFESKLKEIYESMPDFKEVIIKGFKEGSVGCEHEVILRGSVNATEAKAALQKINDTIQNTTIMNSAVISGLDDSAISSAFHNLSNLCNAEEICSDKFFCKSIDTDTICLINCSSDYCKNEGVCNVDVNDNFFCSCRLSGDVVYSGKKCETVTRKSPLSEEGIIGISVGIGGGIILIVTIALIYMCYTRRKKNDTDDSESDIDRTLPEFTIPMNDKVRMSQFRQEERYVGRRGESNYGFEPQPTDLRHHRSMDHGRDQGSFFRTEMDYAPLESHTGREFRFNTYEGLSSLPESRLSRDDLRSSEMRRSAYGPTMGPDSRTPDPDSRRSSQIRPMNPSYLEDQPFLRTENIREGDNILQHIDSERPYAIRRPRLL